MRLTEVKQLTERITISSDIETAIINSINKWIDQYKDNEVLQDRRIHYKDANKIAEALRKKLQPTLTKIVQQNAQPFDDEKFDGYKVKVRIDIDNYVSNRDGSVSSAWYKLYTKGENYIYAAYFEVNINFNDLKSILSHSNNSIRELVSTITHEITHLIQLLRSKKGISTKRPAQYKKLSAEQFYYMSLHELDAFAQGTVTKILYEAKKHANPKQYINNAIKLLSLGVNTLFNREIFPSQNYNEIRKHLKNLSDNNQIKQSQIKAWRYFNKKLYEKLTDALKELK